MENSIKHGKINKLKVAIVAIVLIVFVYSITVFGRYIYNIAREAYFNSKQFYFTSDTLTLSGSSYSFNNWGGVDVYEIGFDLYSYNNKLEKLDYDLDYTVTCESLSDEITCSVGSLDGVAKSGTTATGTIDTDLNNTSRVIILVTPKEGESLSIGDTVRIKVTAKTDIPYEKEISCTYSLSIMTQASNTYSIEDAVDSEYALLKLLNANSTAAQVTIEFDPSVLRLDLNDEIYPNNDGTTTNGDGYINKIIFTMDAESAKNIKFYKVDKSQNYTYPGADIDDIITVNI